MGAPLHDSGEALAVNARLYPEDFAPTAPDSWEVEANLSPAVRRGVRLARIAAYEQVPAYRDLIPLERVMLEFDR